MRYLVMLSALALSVGSLPVRADPASAVLSVEAPPARIMVGESYAFYINVKNVSGFKRPIAIHFTVRDGSIDLDDVGIAKETGGAIRRIPPLPRKHTNLHTLSTAVCEWGELADSDTARCAFYISASAITLNKIPFVISVRDISTNHLLASHVMRYRVYAGDFPTKYLHVWNPKVTPSFPIQQKIIHSQ